MSKENSRYSKKLDEVIPREVEDKMIESDPITIIGLEWKEFREKFPKSRRHLITRDIFENIAKDYDDLDVEAIISYNSVLKNPNINLSSFFNAVRFVSRVLVPVLSKVEAYNQTFPSRKYNSTEQLDHVVHRYYRSPAVQSILSIAHIQDHLLLLPEKFKGFQVLLDAVNTEVGSERDGYISWSNKIDAADKLISKIKESEPKEVHIEMDIEDKSTAVDELKEAFLKTASAIQDGLSSGSIELDKIANNDKEQIQDAEIEGE